MPLRPAPIDLARNAIKTSRQFALMYMLPLSGFILLPISLANAATYVVTMNEWFFIPSVEIVESDNDIGNPSCESGLNVFGPAKVNKGFRLVYTSRIDPQSALCWRRVADPFDANSGWTKWYKCLPNLTFNRCDIK